jgi:hypothetical protein
VETNKLFEDDNILWKVGPIQALMVHAWSSVGLFLSGLRY